MNVNIKNLKYIIVISPFLVAINQIFSNTFPQCCKPTEFSAPSLDRIYRIATV